MNIRRADINDAAGIARVVVDTWKSAYRGIISDDYLNNLSYKDREPAWREFPFHNSWVFVAENDKQNIIGVAAGGLNREAESDYNGELYAIYVDQGFQRQGIGSQLFRSLARSLMEAGIRTLLVWVLSESPYRQFYEGLGGTILESRPLTIEELHNEVTAYGWLNFEELL